MAIPVAVIGLIKSIALKAVFKKVEKEVLKVESESSTSITGTVGVLEEVYEGVDKKKVSGWVTVVIALTYFASSQGYIDPAIAELVNTILSNPEVVEGIEKAVD